MAADSKNVPEDDWRIGFSKTRYADLMEILQSKLSENKFNAIIQALGRKCSGHIGFIKEYQGNLNGYLIELKRRWNEDATVDEEKGIITVASQERTECVCPLIDTAAVSDEVCNCSLGWQKQTFVTVLVKSVDVKIRESIIRGGKRCIFEIKIL
jgi:predicted ArsR family transcriptional regulator